MAGATIREREEGRGGPEEEAEQGTISRDYIFSTANINGWSTRDTAQRANAGHTTVPRWTHLKGFLLHTGTEVLGLQEHHFRTVGGLNVDEIVKKETRPLVGNTWGMIWNESEGCRSGVMILWKRQHWQLMDSWSLEKRVLAAQLQNEEGESWTFVCAHFHHDPARRARQMARLERMLERVEGTMILMADHNSIMHPLLDSKDPGSEIPQILRARDREGHLMETHNLLDAWAVVHPDPETEAEKGYTRGGRRIDKIHLPSIIANHVQGIYTTQVGKSDHLAVTMHLQAEEARTGMGRYILPSWVLQSETFIAAVREAASRIDHLQAEDWWTEMMTIIQVETREEKRKRRKWTPWIRSLQKMVQVSTKRKV